MLEINALGSLRIRADGVALGSFESRTVDALLVYLAYTQQPQSREWLAEFFWSERSQAQSLTNLRVALFRLRQQLAPYLAISRKSVALKMDNVFLDTTALTQGLSDLRPQWSQNRGLSPSEAAQLEAALALYHGDFLADLSLYDCPAFEDWKQIERELLRAQVIEALHHLVTFYIDAGVYHAGIIQAARLIELDPYREEARRQLMFLFARTGQQSAALAHYDSFRRLLLDELSIAPADDTAELAAQIQAGSLPPDLLYQSIASRIGLTHVEPVRIENPYKGLRAFQAEDAASFFGRDGLIAELHDRLKQPTDVRFLAVVGPSGSGKSSLIKAGLIPTVQQEGLPGWQRCHVLELSPGSQPLVRLENGLRKLLAEHSAQTRLRLPAEEALSALIETLSLQSEGLIVLIDQLEELFMLVADDTVRSRFLNLLVKMASDPHGSIWVIVTLRADFYDWPLFYPEFGALVGRATQVVLPLKG
ncbi:MAG: BTAD domain-containing putative transcriptional regulator, partial [Chloroflexota bacterium]